MDLETIIIIAASSGAAVCAIIVFWVCCSRARNRARRQNYLPMGDGLASNKLWVGSNPTDFAPPPKKPKVYVTRAMEKTSRILGRQAANFCRSCKHERTVSHLLEHIGTQPSKYFCLVNDARVNGDQQRQVPLVMAVTSSPCPFLDLPSKPKQVEGLKSVMLAVKHPNVLATLSWGCSKDRGCFYMLRPWSSEGSLKDLIYGTRDPGMQFHEKYPEDGPKARMSPLKIAQVASFGRQVLEGLLHLRSLKISYYNLHSGNVIMFNGACKLSDYEDAFFNLQHAPLLPLLRPLRTAQGDPLVRSFGILLYEMVTGKLPAKGANLGQATYKPGFNLVDKVLGDIFEAKSNATLQSLADDPLFNSVPIRNTGFSSGPDDVLDQDKLAQRVLAKMRTHWSATYKGLRPPAPESGSSRSTSENEDEVVVTIARSQNRKKRSGRKLKAKARRRRSSEGESQEESDGGNSSDLF